MGSVCRIGAFAERIGRSVCTVRRWEAEGRITVRMPVSGQRLFDGSDVQAVLTPEAVRTSGKTVVHCRVSSGNQWIGLRSQVAAMKRLHVAVGLAVDEWVQEIGGGMNLGGAQW